MDDQTPEAAAPEAEEAIVETVEAPEATEAPKTEPELTEDEALAQAYRRAQEGKTEEEAEAEAEAEPEPAPEPVAMPTDMPGALKAHWATMTPEARDAVAAAQRDLSRRMAEQGKALSGLKPFQESLVDAMNEFPAMKDMKPAAIVAEMKTLARINQQFQTNPVQAVLGIIQQHGLQNAIGAYFAGQPQVANHLAAAERRVAALEKQIKDMDVPTQARRQFEAMQSERDGMSMVNEFANRAEHWAKVEGQIPGLLPMARSELPANAPARDVLQKAYDMALRLQGLTPKATVTDPAKVAAARAATAVNVAGKASTNPRPMTEDEELAAAYRRALRA